MKFYRSIELWGEGFDWFDLKRWGVTLTRVNTDNGGSFPSALAPAPIKPEDVNKWTWTIPNREFDYNTLIQE
ncbi:RagB/SusD family nutrient uptake outer membrane protein [Niabella insulamsoli]|uniref:RagB/SusD family nutrient uptake outer membrane protein n=1 Tax=Niabella insulamsoli TaxID=3144874 RepID=UPI003D151B4E